MGDTPYEKLRDFLEKKPASQRVAPHLKKGVEIGIEIDGLKLSYRNDSGKPQLLERAPIQADVTFFFTPQSLESLLKNPAEDVGEFGIAVLKEYLGGGMRFKVSGSLWRLTTGGYLGIMKEGGPSFAKFLAQKGVKNIRSVLKVVKK